MTQPRALTSHHDPSTTHEGPLPTWARKLPAFSALALAACGAFMFAVEIAQSPAASRSWSMAPEQTRTQLTWNSLGEVTQFFGVGPQGVQLEVLAPEGAQFVFEHGVSSPIARIFLGQNTRQTFSFHLIESGQTQDQVHPFEFRTWSATRPLSWSGKGPNAQSLWITHTRGSGKTQQQVFEGAQHYYRLQPGQTRAYLPLPWAPMTGLEHELPGAFKVVETVQASHPFHAILCAPDSMKFHYSDPKVSDSREHEVLAQDWGKPLLYTLVDSRANTSTLEVTLTTLAPDEPIVSGTRSFKP